MAESHQGRVVHAVGHQRVDGLLSLGLEEHLVIVALEQQQRDDICDDLVVQFDALRLNKQLARENECILGHRRAQTVQTVDDVFPVDPADFIHVCGVILVDRSQKVDRLDVLFPVLAFKVEFDLLQQLQLVDVFGQCFEVFKLHVGDADVGPLLHHLCCGHAGLPSSSWSLGMNESLHSVSIIESLAGVNSALFL